MTNGNNVDYKGMISDLRKAASAYRNGGIGLNELKSSLEGLEAEKGNITPMLKGSYTAAVSDTKNAILCAERGMNEAGSGRKRGKKTLTLATVGVLALGAAAYHYVNKIVKYFSSTPAPIARIYEGALPNLEPTPTRIRFKLKNNRTSFDAGGTAPAGEFNAKASRIWANTSIHFDSDGNLSLKVTDSNDPNKLTLALYDNANGAKLVFDGTDAGQYTSTIINDSNEPAPGPREPADVNEPETTTIRYLDLPDTDSEPNQPR